MSAKSSKAENSTPPNELSYPKETGLYNNPLFLILTTAGTIFAAEALIMLVLGYLTFFTPLQYAIFDAVFLTLLISPVLYFVIFKPLNRQIAKRQQAESEKDGLIIKLQKSLAEVKELRGIIPICSKCKKIRDDQGFWQQVDVYLSKNSDFLVSHGICFECTRKLYPDLIELHGQIIEQPQVPDTEKPSGGDGAGF